MKQIPSLAAIDWIARGTEQLARGTNATVAHCIPPIFIAYAKIFHPIYEDVTVLDRDLTWQEEDRSRAPVSKAPRSRLEQVLDEAIHKSTLVYGGSRPQNGLVRVSWADLAVRYGLCFSPTTSAESFTRQFRMRSWPRYLIGPSEGFLDGTEREALVGLLRPYTNAQRCLFHLWMLATQDWKGDLLFEGLLEDVLLFPDQVNNARKTPTHWFPENRGWLVCTDYDLTFSLVGGPEDLIRDLLNSPDLECVPVQPDTRVDSKADLPG